MEFSHNVVGPDFEQSALVSFEFNDVDVSLRLPEHRGDYPSFVHLQNIRNLENISEKSWREHPFGQRYLILINQTWYYSDRETENYAVITNFDVELMVLTQDEQARQDHLKKTTFDQWLFAMNRLIAVEGIDENLGTEIETRNTEIWQQPKQISDIEKMEKGPVEWLTSTLGHIESNRTPKWFTYIPLNKEFLLVVNCDIKILYYEHQTITIPEHELDQLRKDIRTEILDHIAVTYSPELLQHINELNG